MEERTNEFIEKLNRDMTTHKMNKSNIFVFDETITGNSVSLPVVIGKQRESGGGNLNVCYTHEKVLGCYIPFSMPDGTTPFRVFIFRAGKLKQGQEILDAVLPGKEIEFHTHNHIGFIFPMKPVF